MPDAMHTVAVQVKQLHRCLAGKGSEDSVALRKQEMELNRFQECWLISSVIATADITFHLFDFVT